MKKLLSFHFFIISLLYCLAVCVFGCKPRLSAISKEEARAIMDDISRRNLAYEPLTEHDDSMMQRVVAYYKKSGASNDLMEAYYLLGSVYRDLHEAPKALEAFLNGINAADTTSSDCRYNLLARLYGQKCDLLYNQCLYRQAIETERMVYKYAVLAKDTLFMVAAQWNRLGINFSFSDYLTVADECWSNIGREQAYGIV